MIKKTVMGVACALMAGAAPCMAQDIGFQAESEAFQDFFYGTDMSFDEQSGLNYEVLKDQDENTISFYVTPDVSSRYNEDYLADELNAISPAAGIRFTFGFSL